MPDESIEKKKATRAAWITVALIAGALLAGSSLPFGLVVVFFVIGMGVAAAQFRGQK
jgi:hypothetical protein